MIQLICLIEDRAIPPFKNEHGLAIWIKSPAGQVLFDTGSSGSALLHNLRFLKLHAEELDAVAVSHAHNDHTGGLMSLLPYLPPETPLYAHPALLKEHFSNHGQGPEHSDLHAVAFPELAPLQLSLSKEPQEIIPGIWTTGEIIKRPYPEGRSAHHTIVRNGEHIPESYEEDLSLIIESSQGLFLLCGCCHAGLLNTLAHVRRHWEEPIIGVGGGTHLIGASQEQIQQTVAELTGREELEIAWLGHCSGGPFVQAVKKELGDEHFRRCSIGTEIKLA